MIRVVWERGEERTREEAGTGGDLKARRIIREVREERGREVERD